MVPITLKKQKTNNEQNQGFQ